MPEGVGHVDSEVSWFKGKMESSKRQEDSRVAVTFIILLKLRDSTLERNFFIF